MCSWGSGLSTRAGMRSIFGLHVSDTGHAGRAWIARCVSLTVIVAWAVRAAPHVAERDGQSVLSLAVEREGTGAD
jgi:hypothetical protein